MTIACSGCTTQSYVSTNWILAIIPQPATVQTMTGSVNYALAGVTRPVDTMGNLGSLNSAYLNANFTSQTAAFGVDLTIANKNLVATASAIPLVDGSLEAHTSTGALTVACTGSGCGSGYGGRMNGAILGTAGASAAMEYLLHPVSDTSGAYSDLITGLVALTGTAPAASTSVAGLLGSGVATAGIVGSGLFNGFGVVDNAEFATRMDASGNLIAYTNSSTGQSGQTVSFGAGGAAVIQDGTDVFADGAHNVTVTWGRWGSGYAANANNNNLNASLLPSGGLAFITGSHMTTASELASYGSWSGLASGITGSYSLAPGTFPTGVNGVHSGSLNTASATVDFGTSQISAFNVAGSGGGFGTWNASGSGSIASFTGSGISLSGSCSAGSGSCASPAAITGTAAGGFVGTQAKGLISSIGLTSGADKLGGVAYMKR
ncbi:hypothetical protein GALL_450340 [mine drainage metagenome]|uniref:Uncharacterized protein n=1 Tax=mine drainage metagenome TaxID=410659 RepID=A0A1J5Q790_9ZZZZ